MQKGRVVSLKSFGVVEFLRNNSFLLIILCFLSLGIILGIFIFDDFEILKSYPTEYITDYIASREDTAFGKIWLVSMLDSLSILFLLFLLGASLFGVITVPCAVMVKGFFQGGITAFLYSQYGLKGIAFNAIIYIPSTIVFIIVMLIASRESIRFSLKISSLTLNKTLPFNLANDFKDYSIKYVIFSAATFVSAFIDALVSVGFIQSFSLI